MTAEVLVVLFDPALLAFLVILNQVLSYITQHMIETIGNHFLSLMCLQGSRERMYFLELAFIVYTLNKRRRKDQNFVVHCCIVT
jgi:hypothetical protein